MKAADPVLTSRCRVRSSDRCRPYRILRRLVLLLLLLPIGATSLAGQLPLRDPFRPPPPPAAPKKPRTGLQAMAIEEYRLVGIVLAGKQFRAMVEDKSGIGYLLRPGTMLGSEGGRVKEIQRDRVIIEEILQGRGVTSQRREVVLSLTPS